MLFFALVAAEGVAYAATDAQDSVAADLADSVDAAMRRAGLLTSFRTT